MQSHHYTLLSVEFTITSYRKNKRHILTTCILSKLNYKLHVLCSKNQNTISQFKVNLQTTKAEVSGFCISNATHVVTAHKTTSLSFLKAETFLNDMHLKIKFQSNQECIFKLFSYHFGTWYVVEVEVISGHRIYYRKIPLLN